MTGPGGASARRSPRLGTPVERAEDERFLTGRATYVENLALPGALYATFVRSRSAHAHLGTVEVTAARRAPGVVDVLTAADLALAPDPPTIAILNQDMARPWLADRVVRFVGEPVAVVLSETRAQGEDAAGLVEVAYQPLAPVVGPEAAVAEGAPLLFPEAGTNVALDLQFGRDEALFEGCEVVVRQRLVNQRLAPCPLEGRSAASVWDGDRLTHWSSAQSAHAVRGRLARFLDVDEDRVRVIVPDVGGAFGSKIVTYPEELLLAELARRSGRPVRWTETRSESMVALGHGRAQVQHVEVGGRRDGRVLAYRLTVLQDAGAYPSFAAALPVMTRIMAGGVYDIVRLEFNATTVVTNTTPTVAYRGAGRPEATAAIERALDLFAAEIGLDPAEVRRANLIAPTAFPYFTPLGTVYDSGDYERALDLVLGAAGYEELRAEQSRRRAEGSGRLLGVGLSVYAEITAGGGPPQEWGAVAVNGDGRALVRSGSSPHGQGHHTGFAMVAADGLGMGLENVDVVFGDTDAIPRGNGTMASRSLQTGGVAVSQAAAQVREQALAVAAGLLDAAPSEVELDGDRGGFAVAGRPGGPVTTWSEVALAAEEAGQPLEAEVVYTGPSPTFPFGAHVAVVEVDAETGQVTLLRLVAVDDAGRLLNPLLAEGQVHGGLAQGVAQALYEEVAYDEDGTPLATGLADYGIPGAADLPWFETSALETPTPVNPLGAKGIGESGAIGAPPAVQNAVVDALAHLGVRHLDMPCTPERVWQALRASRP